MRVDRVEQVLPDGIDVVYQAEAPGQETGPALIRDLETFFSQYIILPPHALLPLALWSLMTYCFDQFDAVPYLIFSSPAPRCGKTRALECLELVVDEPRRASNISEAALFRTIEKVSPTLLLDEAETLSGKSERAEYLRQILNAGNRRGAVVTRCVGQGSAIVPADFRVFCPKVLSAIGNLPTTLSDRAIVVVMQRRKDSEKVGRFLYRNVAPTGKDLQDRARMTMGKLKEEIDAAYDATELDFIEDRDAEAWAPLFAILATIDPGRLPELKASAVAMTLWKGADAQDDSLPLKLLSDMRDVWPEVEENIFTFELIARLKAIEDSPWMGDEKFNGRKLARFLRPFGIKTNETVRIGAVVRKGYRRDDAVSAFSRYLGVYR